MDTDALIRDYLGRLTSAAASLSSHRRAELVGEVRDHIDAALAEAGRDDEVTVRNILERLGSPEEIVAGEVGPTGASSGGDGESPTWDASGRSGQGGMEIAALVLLGLAWPALFLPFGPFLWLAMGVVGVALVWASRVWSLRRKLITTGVAVALYALLVALIFPFSVRCSGPGETPHACSSSAPTPIVTTQ